MGVNPRYLTQVTGNRFFYNNNIILQVPSLPTYVRRMEREHNILTDSWLGFTGFIGPLLYYSDVAVPIGSFCSSLQ